jgi:hypothetical protein
LKDYRRPTMSSGMNTPLPLRQQVAAQPVPPNLVSNNNLGAGAQKNFQQTGGSHNTQFNADTINYHGEHAPDTHPLAFRSTNGSGVRTNKDPALANLHRALPPRSRLRPPAATGRARREAVCMEQNSCTGRPGRRGVRKVWNPPLNNREADDLQQVATRDRVLLPCAQQITGSMDVLGPREQRGPVRCRYPQARMRRWNTGLRQPKVRRFRACV